MTFIFPPKMEKSECSGRSPGSSFDPVPSRLRETVAKKIGSNKTDLQLRGQLPAQRNSLLSLMAALNQRLAPNVAKVDN